MYTLYTDQNELFEASISVSGASLTDTKCRLTVESDTINLMFTGTIDEDGSCRIPVKALAKYLSEGTKGNLRLEVIAENTYFIPWESPFVVKTHRKVTAEVKSQSKDIPMIVEAKAVVKKPSPHAQYVSELIVSCYKTKSKGQRLQRLFSEIQTYIAKNNFDKTAFEPILNEAVQLLTNKSR